MKHSHKDFIHQSFAKHFLAKQFRRNLKFERKIFLTNKSLPETGGVSVWVHNDGNHCSTQTFKSCFRRLLFGLWFCLVKTGYWTFRRATMSRRDASYCIVQKTFSARLFVSMAQHWWIWHMQNTHPKPHLCPLSVPRHQAGAREGPICGIIPNVLIK